MRDALGVASAWLALWNGFDPALDAEYNDWHAREHVPERLTVPGMLRASRYRAVDDAVYPYFTLYEMASIDVLASAEYQALLQQPTDWTRRMRTSFGELLRIPCQVIESAAGVRGTALMSLQIRGGDAVALQAGMRELAAAAGVVGVHSGREDTAVAPLPWPGGATMCAAQSSPHLLLVEAQALDDLQALARALPAGIAALQPVLRLHRLLTLHHAQR
ncbi:MAG: hypothetical protein RR311_21140 [Comamonas sp.]